MCLHVKTATAAQSAAFARWLRQTKSVVKMRRAQVIASSAQGMRAGQVAAQPSLRAEYVRELIRRFNEDGFDALKPRKRAGRGPALSEDEKSDVIEAAVQDYVQWCNANDKDSRILKEQKSIRVH